MTLHAARAQFSAKKFSNPLNPTAQIDHFIVEGRTVAGYRMTSRRTGLHDGGVAMAS
jgi:hypothetical protein